MKKTALLLVILLGIAPAALAQANEFGVLFGGSKRITGDENAVDGGLDDGFSFSNSAFDLYWATELEPGTVFKIKGGRIETPVGFAEGDARRDTEGEVQHLSGIVEYRFSEPFGSTGLFVGVGAYRHEASGQKAGLDYGFQGGVNGDFPLSRRYGVVVEATYHWTSHDFEPRYLTISGGLRLAF